MITTKSALKFVVQENINLGWCLHSQLNTYAYIYFCNEHNKMKKQIINIQAFDNLYSIKILKAYKQTVLNV